MFGSGAVSQTGTCTSRSAATGLGPRATILDRRNASMKLSRLPSNLLDRGDERARADARQQHDEIELAALEPVGKCDALRYSIRAELRAWREPKSAPPHRS